MPEERFEAFEGSCSVSANKRDREVGCRLSPKQAKVCQADLCRFFRTHKRGRPEESWDEQEAEEIKKEYQKEYQKKWRAANPDYQKEWYMANPNYHRERRQKLRDKRTGKI